MVRAADDSSTAFFRGKYAAGLRKVGRMTYTGATKVEMALTVHMLFGFAFKRKAGWSRPRFKIK